MDSTQEFNCISLCTGYAGIELGLRRVIPNLRTIAYVEIEAFACTNLVAKIEEGKLDAAPIWTNLKTFDGEPFRDRIHLITGGYPCQPFSVAGKRQGTADPRHLWPYIEGLIRAIRPVWCFFENVSGHLTIGFPEVYRSLRLMGYKVEAGLFTAAEVGAPHKRERLFILGYATGQRLCGGKQDSKNQQSKMLRARLKSELGNPRSTKPRGLSNDERQRVSSAGKTGEQLADTGGDKFRQTSNISESTNQLRGKSITLWPTRPGQEQYEWEEPRTVKSGMGRTVDGFRSRVDELRLLGNGVVPQCAELAFRALMQKFE